MIHRLRSGGKRIGFAARYIAKLAIVLIYVRKVYRLYAYSFTLERYYGRITAR